MNQPLDRIEDWFARRGWTPAPFQREVWQAYLAGASGLLHSSTGSGKTLGVWMGILAEEAAGREPARGPVALWLTPLRALAADTLAALQEPLDGLGLAQWRIEARTGDTSPTAKQRQTRNPPNALVTTPESLSLLLAAKDGRDLLGHLRLVVIDEWHELLGTKRGVQTELALARLRRWNRGLRVWGLSATLGNTEEAAKVLHPGEPFALVQGETAKRVTVDSLLPESVERFPWAGHMGQRMIERVVHELDHSPSSLVFTNTRAQAEIWYGAILAFRPEWEEVVGLHHGSLDLEERRAVEQGLKDGALRAVVATSSLDLGVDFSPVERVFQVGSPKGVARLLQRAGRSGHQPGAASRVTCVPTHAMELIDVAAVRVAAAQNRIEKRAYHREPLDVLAQHLVTVAIGGGFDGDDLFEEVRSTAAYAQLAREDWEWALAFVTRGGPTLAAYPDYRKVHEEDGFYTVENRRIAQRHRMNIGTIVSDAAMNVQFVGGGRLGSVEEAFVSRLRKGDRFVFAGRALEFVAVRDMTCLVRRAKSTKGVVPRWAGGRLPLSSELAQSAREILQDAKDGTYAGPEMALGRPMLELQSKWSAIPGMNELLVEQVQTREGCHTFVFPFEGRLVHEGLAALFAYRMSRDRSTTFSLACNDYGFEMLAPWPVDFFAAVEDGLFAIRNLAEDALASLNSSEMARRQFREIARVSGLVLQSTPGKQKSVRQLQVSSGLLYDVFEKYDPRHPLLRQARNEVLEKNLEESRMADCLRRLAKARIVRTEPPRPTPFAFPILVDRLRETIGSESMDDRIRRMVEALEQAAG
ncbi:MAG: ligase-associated DNA damage response DEXH box helicase [Fimbriimonadaceae bacterium]|nr:ligase-associated DNA damage response DEXH box helicase [Fimbriimonadaceae bacterium]QYK55588.1 MAG: ligase-associated DNA damage response DEXH box helicase [Fimbriimonadaceae bacterium]